jgi:hypothetical protein
MESSNETLMERKIGQVLPCLRFEKACAPLKKEWPYGDPMRNIQNSPFWRQI